MKIRRAQETIVSRIETFLVVVYTQIRIDGATEPRMTFEAMRQHLTPHRTISAAVRLGIVHRYGWRWIWVPSRAPDRALADAVYDEIRRHAMHGGFLTPGKYAKKTNQWARSRTAPSSNGNGSAKSMR